MDERLKEEILSRNSLFELRNEARLKTQKSLFELIEDSNWPGLRTALKERPEEIKELDRIRGSTVLHKLCSLPPTPHDIFKEVVELYPQATKIQERKYGLTPLHTLCYYSQRSTSKVKIVIDKMEPQDLLIRNFFGGTPLHSACSSHAWIPVIELLVQANPNIVLARTHEYKHTALTALFHCHLQAIQGHMQVARILQGEQVEENHFAKFWKKVVFLATEAFKLSHPDFVADMKPEDVENYALHGLMSLLAPGSADLNLYKVGIKQNSEWAKYADPSGNYPLHNIIIRRPFRVKDIELIEMLCQCYPEAASKKNNEGRSPIDIALRERMAWDQGVGALVKAQPEILSSQDLETGLFPFLLAASLTGKVAVETTYQLLSANPHLVQKCEV